MSASTTNVLLVDDSLTVRMDLTEALEAAQLHVVACTTLAEANTALAQGRFGLIILDVVLPDGDGVDLLEQIRETPSLNGVAVILLSDEAAVRHRIRGLITGADEYIGKPYDARYVVACAKDLLRHGQIGCEPSQESILVIDDSITFCEQMREALEGASYRVLTANSGEAGLRVAANSRPTAIIVDGTLPGIDGVAVLRSIRLDAALRHIPCILLTASEEKSDEVVALNAGADAFVRKDEDIAIILARVNAALRNARAPADRIKASLQGPKRILVVDGDEDFLRQVTADLRAEGYEIVQARCGEEAFDLLSAQAVDCILLDLDIPGIGSQEACRRIKAVSFSCGMPVIMTAAQDDRDTIIRCLAAGADDYISKSAGIAVLRARVLAQIRRKQFEDEDRLIHEQLAIREVEIANADAEREVSEMRGHIIDRCRAEIALLEVSAGLTREARWGAMGVILADISREIAPALAEIRKCLSHVRRAAERDGAPQTGHLAELFDEALDQAKQAAMVIEKYHAAIAGHAASRTYEDINGIAGDVLSLIVAGGWTVGCDVKTAVAETLPSVLVNKIQVRQVLFGLIRNSIDAMQNAEHQQLTITTMIAGPGTVRVVVADTGVGIAPKVPENLFEQPATNAPADKGLSLRVFRAIVEDHGGKIWSARNAMAGMTVTFELPAANYT